MNSANNVRGFIVSVFGFAELASGQVQSLKFAINNVFNIPLWEIFSQPIRLPKTWPGL